MASLLDIMTPEDQAKMKEWADERLKPKYHQDIPTGLFLCAQLGYYYGWSAVVDFRRGYHVGIKHNNSEFVKIPFTYEEAVGLVEAAKKVHYRLKLDEGAIVAANNASCADAKNANKKIDVVNKLAKEAYK